MILYNLKFNSLDYDVITRKAFDLRIVKLIHYMLFIERLKQSLSMIGYYSANDKQILKYIIFLLNGHLV
jgi:hypothetical protein